MSATNHRLSRLIFLCGCLYVLASCHHRLPQENASPNLKLSETTETSSKEIIRGQADWQTRLQKMGAKAEDIYYIKFYKDAAGRMHGKVTRDYGGSEVVFELGLISWAPETVQLARQTKQQFGNVMGAHFNIHGLQKRTSLGIQNFMQIHRGFALHAPIWGEGPLQHNGFIDPNGHGCVRVTEHQRLYDLAKSLEGYLAYGQGLPILVDYSVFIDTDAVVPSTIQSLLPANLPTWCAINVSADGGLGRVRVEPSTDSMIVQELARDAKVRVEEKVMGENVNNLTDWYFVTFTLGGPQAGYIHASLLDCTR
ncbi:hypothetical protein SAMN06272755_1905 [Picosynechococcus sp. OG1]|nr:hypothetical protein SAMN06272755_1905 [Picosynechococcus sp. OG1]SMQ81241.1 hypothetical protein SAMN06272774_1184 [Synechococcus sp. 7002]